MSMHARTSANPHDNPIPTATPLEMLPEEDGGGMSIVGPSDGTP